MRLEAPPEQPIRVLLIEDHIDTLHVMKRLLMREGFAVTTAETAAEANAAAKACNFDVVLSDIRLPDGNGRDVLRAVRGHCGEVPAIAISGDGYASDIDRNRAAGFD